MATENWANIGSGNGLLPDGTKPLPEPKLTYHQAVRSSDILLRAISLRPQSFNLSSLKKTKEQAWFREGYFITDIIFTLHGIIYIHICVCVYLSVIGTMSVQCYWVSTNTILQSICRHSVTEYLQTPCYRVSRHSVTEYLQTQCHRVYADIVLQSIVSANTMLKSICRHNATDYL